MGTVTVELSAPFFPSYAGIAMAEEKSLYPVADQFSAVHSEWTAVLDFFQFLQEKGYVLSQWPEKKHYMVPINESVEDLLYEFFDIDRFKLDDERRAMLASLREQHD